MTNEVTEVGESIWNHIQSTGLSQEEVSYLVDNNKITEITLSKTYDAVVCIFLATSEDKVAFISYGKPIDSKIDWDEILAEVEEIHENMTQWAQKEKRRAKGEL